MNNYEAPKQKELSLVSDLFIKWLIKYPNSQLVKHVNSTLEAGYSLRGHGHTISAIIDGNLEIAFAHADSENLPILEELTGMTKTQFGRKYWNWSA